MTRNSQLQAVPHGAEADIDVVRRLAGGERDAVAELYDRYAARVMGLALRIVRNSSDAEDVVQEVFCQASSRAQQEQPKDEQDVIPGASRWLEPATRLPCTPPRQSSRQLQQIVSCGQSLQWALRPAAAIGLDESNN